MRAARRPRLDGQRAGIIAAARDDANGMRGFQVYEFSLFGVESDWKQNLWQSCFFVIVGLHGLHILIGGVGVALPYYQALTGKMDKYNHGSIVPASLYWHLVDVVWLLIVAIFYLW